MPLPDNDTLERSPARSNDPYRDIVNIDYSSVDQTFDQNPRGFYLSTAGTLKIDTQDGTEISAAFGVGYHPIRITKIYHSGSSTAVGFVCI
jgi:hypothetical protein